TIKYSYEFQLLSKNALLAWVKNRISISDDAAKLLVEFVGNDLWRMNNEINKLKAYKNSQNITIADIKLLSEEKFDQKIFDLTDAAANKNRRLFIKLADEYLSSGVEPAYILTFLIRQFRMMARAKSLLGKNPTVNLALEIKIHPFVAQKLKTQISNYSIAEIKNIYRKLLKIDIKLKQGYFSPELLFTQLI
ncbi:DNA polymerase III subunit delta, partial [Candidatus Parcubacteria bacterium]|nr:DNA polymerase III subunit delta [Candidatus Parcubacteria bacterium]